MSCAPSTNGQKAWAKKLNPNSANATAAIVVSSHQSRVWTVPSLVRVSFHCRREAKPGNNIRAFLSLHETESSLLGPITRVLVSMKSHLSFVSVRSLETAISFARMQSIIPLSA